MEEIRTVEKQGRVQIYTPYSKEFIAAIKRIGGAKWDANNRCWTVSTAAIEDARQIMTDVFGYSDISENNTITVKVHFDRRVFADKADVTLFGKTLARVRGRDSGAQVGDDVTLVKGDINSGGSVARWESVVEEGAEFVLRNVNETVYNREEIPEGVRVEVIENRVDKEALRAEKERLLARIAEIDKLLEG